MVKPYYRKIDSEYENKIDNVILDSIEEFEKNIFKLNIDPNIVTISRFVLVVIFWTRFNKTKSKSNALIFGLIYLFNYFLDCLDGYIARKYDRVTILGDLLDHLADIIGGALIIYSLYPLKRNETILVILFTYLALAHLGCQQKIYNKGKPKETLDYLRSICFTSIKTSKYFSTPIQILVYFFLFCNRFIFSKN